MTGYRVLRTRGFTLVEALIALVVLSVGLIGLARIQVHVFAASGLGKAQTTAVNLAQQKLEELRMIDYGLIKGDADMPAAQDGDNAAYRRTWVVTEQHAPDYKRVSITASWHTPDGESRSVNLTSFIARSTPDLLEPIGASGDARGDEAGAEEAGDDQREPDQATATGTAGTPARPRARST
jgi:prepilin-type N-terminal cleavage/methylation domain-containing protein